MRWRTKTSVCDNLSQGGFGFAKSDSASYHHQTIAIERAGTNDQRNIVREAVEPLHHRHEEHGCSFRGWLVAATLRQLFKAAVKGIRAELDST